MSDASRLFELLAADHRRRILLVLCQTDSIAVPEGLRTRGAVTRSDIQPVQTSSMEENGRAAGPVTRASGTTTRSSDASARASNAGGDDQVMVELTHNHLPKLVDEGLVAWDRERQVVSRGPRFETVEPALLTIASNAEKFPDDLF